MWITRPARIFQLALLVLLYTQSRAACAAVIDFDSLNDGDLVTNQFPGAVFSNTIVLTAGISLNEFEFPPHSGLNVVSDNNGPIMITFLAPVVSFSGYFTYLVPLTLRAFDASSIQVGQAVSLSSSNLALSGDAGSSPNELLQVAFAAGIASVTVTGYPLGGSFTLDDATLQTAATGVPEPNQTLLLLTGTATITALRRSFTKL